MNLERGTPILLRATIIRERDGKIEAQTEDGELVHCKPDSIIEDKATEKKNARQTASALKNPPPSPGFAESAVA